MSWRWEEDKPGVQELELAFGNEIKDSVTVVLDKIKYPRSLEILIPPRKNNCGRCMVC
jgi:hypothetical protein